MNNNELNLYKNEFRVVLHPLIELFEFKKTKLSETDWFRFIESTEHSIILSPEQFLGNELPSHDIIQQSVHQIFVEFLADQRFNSQN